MLYRVKLKQNWCSKQKDRFRLKAVFFSKIKML
jgi:hypothetical protein